MPRIAFFILISLSVMISHAFAANSIQVWELNTDLTKKIKNFRYGAMSVDYSTRNMQLIFLVYERGAGCTDFVSQFKMVTTKRPGEWFLHENKFKLLRLQRKNNNGDIFGILKVTGDKAKVIELDSKKRQVLEFKKVILDRAVGLIKIYTQVNLKRFY